MVKMLVGYPACGKSTYAQKMAAKGFVVLSSDSIREELFGTEDEQANCNLVFKILYERMGKLLENNVDVILDATNIKKRDRKFALDFINKYNVPVEACVFTTPIEVCKERNSKRDRQVPDYVYTRMERQFTYPTLDEGFVTITEVSI
ncbi:MAG: ATP-binding protein [Lachnospiraceae bacterium]|nr:ATP-binding protein [Lachnospiraceae bacterium]